MDLRNKTYRNNRTGEIVKVIDSFENIAVLENREKVDVRKLTNVEFFTEQIDPKSFFNNQGAYNSLAEKIKNIPMNQIKDEDGPVEQIQVNPNYEDTTFSAATNESAIIVSSEDDERAELARKYGVSNQDNSIQRQNEAFAKLLGENAEEELPAVTPMPQYNNIISDEPVQRIEIDREIPKVQQVTVEDPIIAMFRKTKRNVEFNISLEINDKLPRIDFIEMMEDSYDTSIIDFLSEEFTNKIIQDPSIIRNKIKDKINELVYGKSKTQVNPQITDSVTQTTEEKTKSTRKPRPNTAQGEKPGYKAPSRSSKKETEKNG